MNICFFSRYFLSILIICTTFCASAQYFAKNCSQALAFANDSPAAKFYCKLFSNLNVEKATSQEKQNDASVNSRFKVHNNMLESYCLASSGFRFSYIPCTLVSKNLTVSAYGELIAK